MVDMKKIKGQFVNNVFLSLFYSLFLLFLAIPGSAFALYELNANFSYSKQVYGSSRQNSMVERSYSGAFAVYFLTYTAVEFNYSQKEDILTENDTIAIGSGLSILSIQNRVMTKTSGVGLRQALPFFGKFMLPVVSLGYAKQSKEGKTSYTLNDNGTQEIIEVRSERRFANSAFAGFMLKINVTKRVGLTGSVKSVFPAFKFDQAKDNLNYEAGLAVMF